MAEDRVPYGMIEWYVNTLHVSVADSDLSEDIRKRLEKAKATADENERAIAYALKAHHENQGLYVDVVNGNI